MASQIFVQQHIQINSNEIYQRFTLLALCEDNPAVTGGFPHKVPEMRKALSCHGIVIKWKWHDMI